MGLFSFIKSAGAKVASMVDADLFAAISEEATRLQAEVIEQQTRAVVRLDEAA